MQHLHSGSAVSQHHGTKHLLYYFGFFPFKELNVLMNILQIKGRIYPFLFHADSFMNIQNILQTVLTNSLKRTESIEQFADLNIYGLIAD